MKKIAVLVLCIALSFFSSSPVGASNIEADSYIYDETGTIEDYCIRNINIFGQQYFEQSGNRVIYYISESLGNGADSILREELDSIEYDPSKNIMIVGYSPASEEFYVVHNENFQPLNLEKDVAKIRDEYFMKYLQNRSLGNALMQVYGYFRNIVSSGRNTYVEVESHEDAKIMMHIIYASIIFSLAALISFSVMVRMRVVPVQLLIVMFIVSVVCIIYILIQRIILANP